MEWAEKEEVSMPARPSWDLIQRPIVEGETALCGFVELTNRKEELCAVRNSEVRSMYDWTQFTGQIETFSGHASIENCLRGPERCAFLGRPSVNESLELEKEIEPRRIDEISHVLRSVQRAISVTHLRLSSRTERSVAL